MTSFNPNDTGFSEIQGTLEPILTEVKQLRFGAHLPPIEVGPSDIHESLLEVRQRMDRVEELLYQVTRIKYRAQRAHDNAKDTSEDAWDLYNSNQRSAPVHKGPDFTGPRERYADANLATFEQRRASRESIRLLSFVNEALECVKIAHRGLSDVRQDHLTILRSLQFESSLDR